MIDTPFGRCTIFDAHTHFFGHSFLDGLGRQIGASAEEVARKLGWELPPDSPEEGGRKWVAEMDRHGVDRMMSIHTLPGDVESAGRAIEASGGRLAGYVMVNPLAAGAAQQARDAIERLRFRGVALFPAMFRFSMSCDGAREVVKLADENGLLVFVHCGVLKVGFRVKLGLPCTFDATLATPLHLQPVCAEFPRAKFVIPHLGSGLFRELLMLADQCPNVYADTSGVAGWAKYLAGAPTPAQVIRQAIDVMGAGRLVFGTDSTFFPRGWRRDVFEQQLKIFGEAKLTDEQVAMILGGNLAGLVGSDPAAGTGPATPA